MNQTTDYKDLIKRLRAHNGWALNDTLDEAAAAIEELLRAASAMHTWIFLNTEDEEAAYADCGLSPEMNAALGYGGQFVMEPPKEEM